MTGTTFSSREWCETDDSAKENHFTEKEKLEDACWNGLLKDMFPEIFGNHESTKLLFLWQINEASSFIQLELGEFPTEKDKFYSIDPYSFLKTQSFN